MHAYLDELRENIRYYRMKKGWSQSKLAIQADSSNGQIGNIESGNANPSLELLLKIAEALEVSPADLFIRDASKLQNIELYRKYLDLIENCEYIPEYQQKTVKTLARNLAEAAPNYPNYK